MLMKKILMATLIAGALLIPAADAAPKNRQKRQGARIGQGAQSGSLTGPEAQRLGRQWGKLNRSIARDRRDGGGLTARERIKIDNQQDRLSRQIYRQKHDRQTRPH
jgi:hypothetical protein